MAGGAFTRGDYERYVKTLTVNGATPVVVPAPEATANSIIHVTIKTVSGTQAATMVTNVTPGVSFTIVSSAGNNSLYNYVVF